MSKEEKCNTLAFFKSNSNEDLTEYTWKPKGNNNPLVAEGQIILNALQAATHMQATHRNILTNC